MMSWSPDEALDEQVELLVQSRTKDLMAARQRVMKECEADAAKRGMLKSGPHIGAVMEQWGSLLRQHGEALLTDLIGLVESFAELTPDSAKWIQSRFENHINQLTDGTAHGLAAYVQRLGIRLPQVKEHVEGETHRAGNAVKAAAALQIRMATGKAVLKRKQSGLVSPPAGLARPAGVVLEGLHPRVLAVAGALFRDGHYRQAILDAYIALADDVREAAGLEGVDNTPLMQRAFSAKEPILEVGDDADEQLGFMWLYSGAVMAIRNPKAHRLVEQKDPQRALEWLAFASVLFRVLDDARKAE